MKRLYNLTLTLIAFVLLGLFSAQELYAQSAPNLAQTPNIVGGETVTPGTYPWQAALVAGGEQFCGGSLITPDWVLTAAHCIEGQSSLQVMLGAHTLSNNNESSRQVIDVSEIIAYPMYSTDTLDGDIALLKLSKPATLNDRVQTISLLQNEAAAGTPATVTGWGAIGENDETSDTLREVIVPLVSRTMCNRAYQGDITNNMICAGTGQADKDSCYGDSGGPLVVSDGGDGWLQAGVVSWGDGCAVKDSYGVYTNVTQFTDWVQGHLSGNTPPTTPTPPTDDTDEDTGDDADNDDADNNDESDNDPDEDTSDEFEFVDWYEIAAQTIGIDVDALFTELDAGRSIADVATDNNVDAQTIIDALQSAEEAFIQELLADEAITQEEADGWLAELSATLDEFVNEQMGSDVGDGPELPEDVDYVDWFELAAQTIGIDVDSLWDELEKDQSIADVANTNGVDPQSIIDALVAVESTFIQQLLDSDYITQEESDEWTAMLPEEADSFVNDALVYDLDETGDDTIFDEGEEGEQCDAEHEDADKPEDEDVAGESEDQDETGDENSDKPEVQDAGDEGDQEDIGNSADEPEDEEESGDTLDEIDDSESDDSEIDDGEDALWVDWFEVAARTLNMDIEELFDALDQGQSIAEIAVSNNVDNQTIVDAIVSEEQAMIEKGVTDGFFSQKEADEWLADLPEIAAHFVKDSNGCTDVEMIEGVDWFDVAAQTIGIDEESFWSAIDQGQTVAEIAQANGADSQAVIGAIIQAETEMVNQEVASGLVSQADADEWLAELDTFVAEFVDMGFMDEGMDDEMDDEMEEDMDETVENGDGRTTGQSIPNTIKGASMTLGLHKNVQAKTPTAFQDNFIYLPAVMK